MKRHWSASKCKPLAWLGNVLTCMVGGLFAALILLMMLRVGL